MSSEGFDKFNGYYDDLKSKIDDYKRNRTKLSSNLTDLIKSFFTIENDIINSLIDAKTYHNKSKRDLQKEISNLRHQKRKWKRTLENLEEELEGLSKPKMDNEFLRDLDLTSTSIDKIDEEIVLLYKEIEEKILEIQKENEILERIAKLKKKRKIKLSHLEELKKRQDESEQKNLYYKLKQQMAEGENRLKDIKLKLDDYLSQRLNAHQEMLKLYQKAKKFEYLKNLLAKELVDNKFSSDISYQLFLKLDRDTKRIFITQPPKKVPVSVKKPQLAKSTKDKRIIKQKKIQKRLEKKKVETALEKQKKGKKLDIEELKLIYKQTKKNDH